MQKDIERPELAQFMEININIPPIIEHIFDYAEDKNIDLPTAILEVRNSKNASQFRSWVSEISPYLDESRKNWKLGQKIYAELEKISKKWGEDIDSEVKYKWRTLKLSSIPFSIGKILLTVGLTDIHIKDPIISIEKPYKFLMFVNDLYRPPQ